jgi:hypothetical protein
MKEYKFVKPDEGIKVPAIQFGTGISIDEMCNTQVEKY